MKNKLAGDIQEALGYQFPEAEIVKLEEATDRVLTIIRSHLEQIDIPELITGR